MLEIMIPSPLSFFAVFSNYFKVRCRSLSFFAVFSVLCGSLRCLVINLKFVVVACYRKWGLL